LPKTIDEIAGKIMSDMEKLLLERVYIAILKDGEVLYASTALDKHLELLKLFAITEFKDLNVLGHAFPLAGTNLAIFKISEDILLSLYTKKGYQGQLLSFKTKMDQYVNDLKEAVKKPVKLVEPESKGQILPKLVETVSLTIGLSEDESAVLKLCDGLHSIKEIIDKTRIPRKKVVDIIRHFENKGWLKLQTKGEVELIPISIKKFPETAVRLGMISKKSYDINELCDGKHTIKDIADKLVMSEKELKKILAKMEKNKIIKMTVKIPEEEPSITEVPTKVEEVPVDETKYPELNIKPVLATNVSFTLGFDEKEKRILSLLDGSHTIDDVFNVTQIPYLEIFSVIIKYEEKGWIRIPIDEFIHIVAIKEKMKSSYKKAELEEKYQKLIEEKKAVLVSAPEVSEKIPESLEVPEKPILDENEIKEKLSKRIQEELPLMPADAQKKLLEKLMRSPAEARETLLEKLLSSEASQKFKKVEKIESPPAPTIPSDTATPATLSQPSYHQEPIIDESPLVRPSELLEKTPSADETELSQKEPLLTPEAPQSTPHLGSLREKIATIGEEVPQMPSEPIPSESISEREKAKPIQDQSTTSTPSESLSKEIAGEEDQVNEVLNFIDSLLGIPEILYLALVDFKGTIFYQTTKEAELWDITKDVLKMIQNWNAQAPSIYLGGIKFATIKAAPDALIATNIKGLGHIVAIPINDNLFIFTKVRKDGDVLLISDDIAIVAKQIKEMF